jgi:prefoldin subunit 5
MKKQLKQKIIIACLLSMPIISNAQFNLGITPALRTTAGNTSVGIGNFPTTPSVQSRLHVNNFLLGAPAGALNGFLFRTDGDQSVVNQWQLFTGTSATTQTQRFRLFVPATSNNVFLEQSQIGGIMGFNTGGNITRMIIRDGGVAANDGFAAIGNNLPSTFIPQERVHIHHTTGSNVFTKYTHITTGTGGGDGFNIGINATGAAQLVQNEALPIQFLTFGNNPSSTPGVRQRMEVTANGTMPGGFDGLRIYTPGLAASAGAAVGALDLWTSTANQTHIQWDGSGLIQGSNNRFEQHARLDGFWFNAQPLPNQNNTPRYRFNILSQEVGRIGNNQTDLGYWRIGRQITPSSPIDATRRLEVFDNEDQAQLRLTQNYIGNIITVYTDFQTTGGGNTIGAGNLLINPRSTGNNMGFVAINLINANTPLNQNLSLDVNGQANIRHVENDDNIDKILVWDDGNNGRVRWRDASTLGGGTSGFGFVCNDPNAALTTHRHVNLNDNNFYFEPANNSLSNTENNVGFGYDCADPLRARVDALDNRSNPISGRFLAQSNQQSVFSTGIYAVGSNSDFNTGVLAAASTGNVSSAIECRASADINSYGLKSFSFGLQNSTNSFGTYSIASGNGNNYGVYGEATPTSGAQWAGYFAGNTIANAAPIVSDQMFKTNFEQVKDASKLLRSIKVQSYNFDTIQYSYMNFDARKQVGFIAQDIEQVFPNLVYSALYPGKTDSLGNQIIAPLPYKAVNYDGVIPYIVQAINEITIGYDRETLSDQQLKTNVQTLSGSLNKVRQMRGITYNWNHSANPNLNLDSLTHIGFVAQEVNAVEPLLTFIDDSSYMHVNYQRFVPVLLQSIKELDNQVQQKDSIIQSLDSRLTQLEQLITQCCNAAQNRVNNNSQNEAIAMLEVTLSSKNVVVLNQNVPNPFAEQTSISFQIPDDVKYAQMIFTDNLGKIIKTMDIEQRGKGVITVFADDLSTGVYTYTLIIDGKAIDSKRMIKK